MSAKQLLYNLLFLLLLFANTGCKKFLDAKPDDQLAVPETVEQLQALLDYPDKMNYNLTPIFGEASTDDYYITDAAYNAVEFREIYNWKLKEYSFANDWSEAYEVVYVSNFVLEGLQKIAVTENNRQQYNNAKGAALFHRSHNFLNLLWVYAKAYDASTANVDLGIALRSSSDFNKPSVRSTVKEAYERVLLDAKEATALLPALPVHTLRPSKASAFALLARAYVSMRLYDSALVYANKALALKNTVMNFNNDVDIPAGVNAAVPFKRFNKETIFYSEMGTTFGINGIYRAYIDTALLASYNNNDLRKKAFYTGAGNSYAFKGSYSGNSNQYFTGITTAEMIYTKAECMARTGQWNEAMIILNDLLQTRWDNAVPYIPLTASSAATAVQHILSERRKELYMRGLRFMDIKRLNKEGANITLQRKIAGQTYTLLPNANYYALPLPTDIIQLTGMPQNPE
jgi:hypothetical protein